MSRRGFTLVEMLVVLGIIAVLAALLLPAVMMAVNTARRAAIASELSALSDAVTAYKNKTQDYPPNFRDYGAFIRHVRKVYPSIDNTHLNAVVMTVWPGYSLALPPPPPAVGIPPIVPTIDEGESLVLWLYLLDNDKRMPFKAILSTTPLLAATSPEKLFPFKEERFIDGSDTDSLPSYRAIYSGETFYLYIDSRSYDDLIVDYSSPNFAAYGEDPLLMGYVRPYWSEIRSTTGVPSPPLSNHFKPMNPTTFQLLCAGQDGLFGPDPATPALKFFPGGGGYDVSGEDNDNMTSFSENRRLEDHFK